jgi:hypothetical protein
MGILNFLNILNHKNTINHSSWKRLSMEGMHSEPHLI